MNRKRRQAMKYGSYRPHKRIMHDFSGDGRTRQEFAAECDINTIMRRYGKTGALPVGSRAMKYGDFTEVPDFMTAMNVVARANEAFAELPAKIRKRFSNDPAEFCDYVSDPENIAEVRKLGLAADLPEKVPAAGATPPAGGVPPAPAQPPLPLEPAK